MTEELDVNVGEFQVCCKLLRDTYALYQFGRFFHRGEEEILHMMHTNQLLIFANLWGPNLYFTVFKEVHPESHVTQAKVEEYCRLAKERVDLILRIDSTCFKDKEETKEE